jgi:hypothetical protein
MICAAPAPDASASRRWANRISQHGFKERENRDRNLIDMWPPELGAVKMTGTQATRSMCRHACPGRKVVVPIVIPSGEPLAYSGHVY